MLQFVIGVCFKVKVAVENWVVHQLQLLLPFTLPSTLAPILAFYLATLLLALAPLARTLLNFRSCLGLFRRTVDQRGGVRSLDLLHALLQVLLQEPLSRLDDGFFVIFCLLGYSCHMIQGLFSFDFLDCGFLDFDKLLNLWFLLFLRLLFFGVPVSEEFGVGDSGELLTHLKIVGVAVVGLFSPLDLVHILLGVVLLLQLGDLLGLSYSLVFAFVLGVFPSLDAGPSRGQRGNTTPLALHCGVVFVHILDGVLVPEPVHELGGDGVGHEFLLFTRLITGRIAHHCLRGGSVTVVTYLWETDVVESSTLFQILEAFVVDD